MNKIPHCQIKVISVHQLNSSNYDGAYNQILALTEDHIEDVAAEICSSQKLRANLNLISKRYPVEYYVYLSSADHFKSHHLVDDVRCFISNPTTEIALLLPYLTPPIENFRTDTDAQSFIISKKTFETKAFPMLNPIKFIYSIVNFHVNSPESKNIEIIQVGKPSSSRNIDGRLLSKIQNSSIQIVHKGPLSLLKRCLTHLNNSKIIPKEIEICFDDRSFKKLDISEFRNIENRITLYKNTPIRVGPFLARQFMVEQSNREYIYLLDSDDIAVKSRFSKLMLEIEERNLDLLGSHELRIDQIGKKLAVIRFPLNVNFALEKKSFHPLLHGTCIVSRKEFLRAGGYSTDGKFGYDSQFLLRAFFFLRIGNIDDFLYLRFQRKNSLTTAKKTTYGTKLRGFMAWRWKVDFDLVYDGKLNLSDSSLFQRKHNFSFKIVKV